MPCIHMHLANNHTETARNYERALETDRDYERALQTDRLLETMREHYRGDMLFRGTERNQRGTFREMLNNLVMYRLDHIT